MFLTQAMQLLSTSTHLFLVCDFLLEHRHDASAESLLDLIVFVGVHGITTLSEEDPESQGMLLDANDLVGTQRTPPWMMTASNQRTPRCITLSTMIFDHGPRY